MSIYTLTCHLLEIKLLNWFSLNSMVNTNTSLYPYLYVRTVYEYMYAQSWETTSDFTANPVFDAATNVSYDLREGLLYLILHLALLLNKRTKVVYSNEVHVVHKI